jgi:predicted nucleic acid-binding protein
VSAKQPVYVLDSFAVLAYLGNEIGGERVQMILEDASRGKAQVMLSIINLGEVLYITEREVGLVSAQAALAAIEQLPIEILQATKEVVLAAAHVKANYPVAYADAFAIVAAQEASGAIITGDPEFQAIQELVTVEWLVQKG